MDGKSGKWWGVVAGLTGAVALVVGGAGCDTAPPEPVPVTALHITTETLLPSNPPPPIDLTITDGAAARAAYQLTLALPDFSPGTYNCPNDSGVRYRLDFISGALAATKVIANPGGCREVQIPGTSERRMTGQYWSDLAQAIGVDEASIFPYPAR